MADRSKTDSESVAAAAVDAAAPAETEPTAAELKAAAAAEYKAAVAAAKAKVVDLTMYEDNDRFAGMMSIEDADGVVHEFEIPKGAVLEDFEKDHLAMVTHRHRVRNVPGTP